MNRDGIEMTNGNVDTVDREGRPPDRVGTGRNGGRSSPEKAAKEKVAKKAKGKSSQRNGDGAELLGPISLDTAVEAFISPAPHDDRGSEPLDAAATDHQVTSSAAVPEGTVTAPGGGSGDPDDQPVPEPAAAAVRRPRWRGSRVLLVCAAIAIGALSVALALSLLALGNQNALSSSRTTALAVARTDAVQLASYDYRHLDRNFATVADNTTASFRRSFTQSSDALKSTLVKFKATASATVVSAGLVSASASKAVALVLLDQRIANSTQKAPTTDRSQVEITLVSSGGRWLIDQVTLL